MIGKREMQKITMTEKLIRNENEAIEAIKANMPTSGYQMLRESLDMAIKALEEIQQYREIGTVEQVGNQKYNLGIAYKIISDYQNVGTVEECREAVEKQKPIFAEVIVNGWNSFKCPSCGRELEIGYKHCIWCGQHLKYKSMRSDIGVRKNETD